MKTSQVLADEIGRLVEGEVSFAKEDIEFHSHDASLFEVKPRLIVYPKDAHDIEQLTRYVDRERANDPSLSVTVRSGGTDMSGGAINDSIIVNIQRHMNQMGEVKGSSIVVQPGMYYRDFEKITMQHNLLLPSYPASREICTLGGMVANNSGGEKSLQLGKTDDYVRQVKVVLRDGKEYVIRPLRGRELESQLAEEGLLGDIYRQVWSLVKGNQSVIDSSRPKVTKNSTGYNIWDVWDGTTLDLTKLIVGSQGTLGVITEAEVGLVSAKPLSGMVVLFMPSLENLGEIINTTLQLKPTTMESFDEHTLKFAFRFFLSFRKTLGWKKFILLGLSFIPLLKNLARYLPRLPKLILMVEFEADTQDEIDAKLRATIEAVKPYGLETHMARDRHSEEKFWVMRRESFNLLRKNVKKLHTAPFIDDIIVPVEHLPKFLPELTEILERYKLLYTVAGHMGDGNFHIIPLMDFADPTERAKIGDCLSEVTDLLIKYDGLLAGEHNDGLIRGPSLGKVYPPEVLKLHQAIKTIFDPDNIFNPRKKTTASWEYSESKIRTSF